MSKLMAAVAEEFVVMFLTLSLVTEPGDLLCPLGLMPSQTGCKASATSLQEESHRPLFLGIIQPSLYFF